MRQVVSLDSINSFYPIATIAYSRIAGIKWIPFNAIGFNMNTIIAQIESANSFSAIAKLDVSIQNIETQFDNLTDAAASIEIERLGEIPNEDILSAIGKIRSDSVTMYQAVHVTALSILSRIESVKEDESYSSAEARTALTYPLNLLLQSIPTAGKKRSQFVDWVVNYAAPSVGFNSKLWFTPSAKDRASQSKDSGIVQGAFYLPKGWQGAATAPIGATDLKVKAKPFNLVNAAKSPYFRPRDYKRDKVVSSQLEARSVFHVTEGINKSIDNLVKMIDIAPTITELKAIPAEEIDKYKPHGNSKAVGIIDSDKRAVERVGRALKTAKLLLSVAANSRMADDEEFDGLVDDMESFIAEFKRNHADKAKALVNQPQIAAE